MGTSEGAESPASRIAAETVARLQERSDPRRRDFTSGYFPTALRILGVAAPDVRTVVRRLRDRLRPEGPEGVLDVVWALHGSGVHEARQVAWEILDHRKEVRARLGTGEVKALGKGNDNWASVDGFSVFVTGPLWRERRLRDRSVLAWTRSPDRWWRRTALVSTVPLNLRSRGGSGDPPRTYPICAALVGDRDPMVAKALSWALRALVPVDPQGVSAFLVEHDAALPPLVRREVRSKLETGRKNPRRRPP